MKATLVSHSDAGGGAARAAFRLHLTLRDIGIQSRMRVASRRTDDRDVTGPTGKVAKALSVLRPIVASTATRWQLSGNPVQHSLSFLPSAIAQELNASDAEVVNLHWVCAETMSIADIGRIRKPVVWTLHDTWAFCGSEHYPATLADRRSALGYTPGTRAADHRGLDLDAWVWKRKRRAWRRPMDIVAPSKWVADLARQSKLMQGWPVQVIANPLPVDTFMPCPKSIGRQLFGLPRDAQLLLFGAVGGTAPAIKGWDLLEPALRQLAVSRPGCQAVVLGQSRPASAPNIGMPIHYVGRLEDNASLALLYSAVDAVVVPSRLDNLPQVGTEAQACGVPVVAFDCAGLPEVVDHQHTGFLARPYDPADLARGLAWVLEDEVRRHALGVAARDRAVARWSPAVIAPQYQAAYQGAIDRWRSRP